LCRARTRWIGLSPRRALIDGATINGTFAGFATNMSAIDGRLNYSSTQVTFSVTATDGIFRDTFEGGSNDTPCALAVPPT